MKKRKIGLLLVIIALLAVSALASAGCGEKNDVDTTL